MDRVCRLLAGHERLIWTVVVVATLLDLSSTIYGLSQGLPEANPVARSAFERYGAVGLGGLKLLALSLAYAVWWLLPRDRAPLLPAALAVPWVGAVCVNLVALSTL